MPTPAWPTSLPAFIRRFPTEQACFEYLTAVRWPDPWRCAACGATRVYARKRRLMLECANCSKLFSATSGTVMHRSRQPLSSWLIAAYLLVTDKRGISATQLQRVLGLKRYEVAYQMLHKLRAAMVAPSREKLRGLVEVDETLVGGVQHGRGKGTWKGAQQIVIGAVEARGGQRPGRVRLRHLPAGRMVLARKFLEDQVDADAKIRTDGGYLYNDLSKVGFHHEVVSEAHGARQEEVLPTLHLVFSNLKTWLQGTFHGSVRKRHLQAYLNEFTFRFNRRANLHAALQRVLGLGSASEGPTYAGIYAGSWAHPDASPPDPAGRSTRGHPDSTG